MKKIFFILIILFCCNISFAQISVERQVIGSTGNLTNTGIIKSSSSVGESVISTFSQSTLIVTQGFQQPEDIITGIHSEDVSVVNVSAYPNPTTDFINIEITGGMENRELIFSLFNIFGQSVYEEKISNSLNTFSIKFLPSGYYIYKITNERELEKIGKIIKH
ncbi:MAG: T9SS type A sorting domain-containing protein [Patescibacteria group bacterium]